MIIQAVKETKGGSGSGIWIHSDENHSPVVVLLPEEILQLALYKLWLKTRVESSGFKDSSSFVRE